MPRIIRLEESTPELRRVYFRLVDNELQPALHEQGKQPQIRINGSAWQSAGIGCLHHIGGDRYFAQLAEPLVRRPYATYETRYEREGLAPCPGETVQVQPAPTAPITEYELGDLDSLSLPKTTPGPLVGQLAGLRNDQLLALKTKLGIAKSLVESKDINKNKTSKVRQLFLDLAYPKVVFDPAIGAAAWGELEKVRATYEASLSNLFFDSPGQSLEETLSRAEKAMRYAFHQARTLGLRSVGLKLGLEDLDKTSVERAITEEMGYLSGFLTEYKVDSLKMPFGQRMQMYGKSLDGIFNAGAVAGLPVDAVIHWRMSMAEHCRDCPRIAAGGPYTRPGGSKPLPSVPRSGHTKCKTNCLCYLEFSYRGVDVSGTPSLGMHLKEVAGEVPTIKALATKHKSLQAEIDDIHKKMAYHRQMVELSEGEERLRHARMRRALNEQLVKVLEAAKATAVPRASVDQILAPVKRAQEEGFLPVFKNFTLAEPSKKAWILNGLSAVPGEVVRRQGEYVRVRTESGAVRRVWLNDSDTSVLFVEPTPTKKEV